MSNLNRYRPEENKGEKDFDKKLPDGYFFPVCFF